MALATSLKGKEKASNNGHMRSDSTRSHDGDDVHSSTFETSEDESESSDTGSDTSDDDSDFGPADPAYLASLLQKAKQNMAAKSLQKKGVGFGNDDVIRLDEDVDDHDVDGYAFFY